MLDESCWNNEGKVRFQVGRAFYNPESKFIRDLGVLAATVEKQQKGILRVLDAFGGCGIRSLRYLEEAKADFVWLNEGNPNNNLIIQKNLQSIAKSDRYRITHQDANRLFFDCFARRDYYDLVDVDCFGSAVPYLSTMLWATRIGGLMYLTSTDGRTLTGHPPEKSVATYGAIARSHPARHEQALRLLLGTVQQQAAMKGLEIKPIFSLFAGKTYRLMLRLIAKPNITHDNYGFLVYCHHCGNYQTKTFRQLNKISCDCSNPEITVSGAMWLGKLHDASLLQTYIALAEQRRWSKLCRLLTTMIEENDLPPYFYTLREIGKFARLDLPKRSHLIQLLQAGGYLAALTHINPQAIKTNASLQQIVEIITSYNKRSIT